MIVAIVTEPIAAVIVSVVVVIWKWSQYPRVRETALNSLVAEAV